MIVKNEEQNIGPCLDSVNNLFDEVIIVDTGSTDATLNIIRNSGAKVVDFPWRDDFAAARNEAMRHARGDWVFWMDADDRLDEENRRKLRKLLSELPQELVGYTIKYLCLPDPETGTATIIDRPRLLPNRAEVRWEYRVHEQVRFGHGVPKDWLRSTDIVIHHVGLQDIHLRKKKLERNLRLLEMEYQQRPTDPFILFYLGSTYLEKNAPQKALGFLQAGLDLAEPTDVLTRKFYALIAQCYRLLEKHEEARQICQSGLGIFPRDSEILFQKGLALQKLGNKTESISCLLQLVEGNDGTYRSGADTGIRGCKAHHNLAILFQETEQWDEAEKHWHLALEYEPGFLPSLVGLGEFYIRRSRGGKLHDVLIKLANHPHGKKEHAILKVRKLIAEKDYGAGVSG